MKFFSTIVALTLSATFCYAITAADVQASSIAVNDNVTAFRKAIAAFNSNPSIMNMIPIATAVQGTLVTCKTFIANAQGAPMISAQEAATLAPYTTDLANNVVAAFDTVLSIQAVFTQVPLVGQLATPVIGAITILFSRLLGSLAKGIANVPVGSKEPFLAAHNITAVAFAKLSVAYGVA